MNEPYDDHQNQKRDHLEVELEQAIYASLSQSDTFDVTSQPRYENSRAASTPGSTPLVTPDIVIRQGKTYLALEVSFRGYRSFREIAARKATHAGRIREQLPEGSRVALILSTAEAPLAEIKYTKNAEVDQNLNELVSSARVAFGKQGFDAVIFLDRDAKSALVVNRGNKSLLNRWVPLPDAIQEVIEYKQDSKLKPSDGDKGIDRAPGKEGELPPRKRIQRRANRYLLVADEWSPAKGGISSFNLEFAKALRDYGREVCIALPAKPTDAERQTADSFGIKMASPANPIPGIEGLPALLSGIRYVDGKDFQPNVLVGHGRILGPYAYALNKDFPAASRVHIVHMHAEELERAKEGDNGEPRTKTAQDRIRLEVELAKTADVVAGVGGNLTDWIVDQVHADDLFKNKGGQTICLIPGLRRWERAEARIPSEKRFLILARADDFELKGVETAICAVGEAKKERPDCPQAIKLIIRGVPEEHAQIKTKVDSIAKPYGYLPILFEYTSNIEDIKADLNTASAVLMPSKTEGFGLSAYEAIAAGIPVLVTKESGLARLIKEVNPSRAQPEEVLPPLDTRPWVDALLKIIDDPQARFRRAQELKNIIENRNYWKSSISDLEQALAKSKE